LVNFVQTFKQKFKELKVLDRYLMSEVAGPFLFGMIGFIVIGMVDIVFTLIDMFINNGVPFLIVLKLLVFKIPAIMVLFFPMAALFSTLLVLIRMSKDSEITVFRAGGISFGRIVTPIIIAGFFASILSFYTNEMVVPYANRVSDDLIRKAVIKKPTPDLAENTFFKESKERYFHIKKISKDKNEMEQIIIYEMAEDYPRVIIAKNATWDGRMWTLKDGTVHKYDVDGLISYQGKFETMKIHVDQEIYKYYKSQKSPREMSSSELKSKIKDLRSSGVQTIALAVDYHMKYSIPLACFIFAIVGTGLVLTFMRNNKDIWGVVLSVLIALMSVGFYFFVMATFRSLGRGGFVPPFIGAWGPNIIFGIAGIALIVYQSKKR